jgi:ribosomal protein L40E
MHAAERSTCVKCGAYGLLDVKPAGLLAPREREGKEIGLRPPALAVRCRKCGHEWVIE